MNKLLCDLKGIKIGFISILVSSSFVLMLGVLHYQKGLPQYPELLMFSFIGYILAFTYKSLSMKQIKKKHKDILDEIKKKSKSL